MIKAKKYLKNAKLRMIKVFFFFSIMGLFTGVFFSMNMFGEKDEYIKFKNQQISTSEAGKVSLLYNRIYGFKEDEANVLAIENILLNKVYKKNIGYNELLVPKSKILEEISKINIFIENGSFAEEKYRHELKKINIKPVFFEEFIENEIKINIYNSFFSKKDFTNNTDNKNIAKNINENLYDVLVFNLREMKIPSPLKESFYIEGLINKFKGLGVSYQEASEKNDYLEYEKIELNNLNVFINEEITRNIKNKKNNPYIFKEGEMMFFIKKDNHEINVSKNYSNKMEEYFLMNFKNSLF